MIMNILDLFLLLFNKPSFNPQLPKHEAFPPCISFLKPYSPTPSFTH